MKRQQVTINHVASRAGVSIKTVSRVFNDEPNVRSSTREKVLEAARELNYWPNLSARRLASNRSFVIALLYDNPQSDYVADIQAGALKQCRADGYNLLIHPCQTQSPQLADDILRLYRQSTVDGLILTPPVSDLEPLLDRLTEDNLDFVRVSQRPTLSESPCVAVDDEEAAFKMTQHLLSLGHRKIGFIMGHPDHGASHDRLVGFRAAMRKAGIEHPDHLFAQGLFTFDSGRSCAQRLLGLRERPTAIFASNDHMAMGALVAAHECKIEVPTELSVCGFDDSSMALYAWPPLTTVRQPVVEVAALAAQLLLRQLSQQPVTPILHRLKSRLMIRQSTGPLAVH